jgi:hypothetical protein
MYMPSVNKEFYTWNSNLSVQNLTGSQMNIMVEFFAGTPTAIHSVNADVDPYTSWHIAVGDEATLPTDYNGSAVVSASGPVAVVDNQFNPVGATQDYNGISEGATELYCPGLYDGFYGWISSLNVQNIGTTDANVTVDYSDGSQDTVVIGPNAAHLFVYNTGTHDTFFSAVVTGDQALVAIANANNVTQSQTYECFNDKAMELRTPLSMKWFVGAYNTGLQVQNVTAAEVNATITYEGYEADAYSVAIPANGVHIFYTPGESFLPDGYAGAASVTADGDIVGICNQTNDAPGSATGDFSLSFDMFLVTP